MSFNLISTADERTWSENEKILFLGEWCLKHSRKHVWNNLNYKICEPLFLQKTKRKSSVENVFDLVRIFLPKLAIALNKYHKTNYSEKYWKILIGHWLIRFISTVSNRYYSLNFALEDYNVSSISFLKSPNYKLATMDTTSFTYATNCEIWNNMIYQAIFHYLEKKDIKINFVKVSDNYFQYVNLLKKKITLKREILNFTYKFMSKFNKDDKAVISNSYLSTLNEIKLNYFFNQLPYMYVEQANDYEFHYNRKKLTLFPIRKEKSLFQFLNKIIFSSVPVIYLENFLKLKENISIMNLPKKPRFVFTSNKFDSDEIFKGWIAQKVENSVPYFVGQHGNNYGQHIFDGRPIWPERTTSNGFITWGWDDGCRTTVKGFNFKKLIKKNNKTVKEGLVLITTCAMFRYYPWDVVKDYKNNLLEQYGFLNSLSKGIFNQTIVRLHHTSLVQHNIDQFGEKENLKEQFPEIKIDDGITELQTLVNNNKLFVFSYDGTGILEFLNTDIPFIAFWPDEKEHLLNHNRISKLYDQFYDVGIFFKNGKEAATFLNNKWNEVDAWWNSKKVITAKNNFKNHFSLYKSRAHYNLGKIIREQLKKVR